MNGEKTVNLTVVIVDDEEAARHRMRYLVAAHPQLQLVGEAPDGPTAVEQIEALQPDLVFLDVQMPAMDGFEVLRQLSSEQRPAVVFVTAYDHYAVEAFEVSAVDYLLKPISDHRFESSVVRVTQSLESKQSSLDHLLETAPVKYVEQLPVRFLKRVKLLQVDEISHIVSEHRVVHVYSREGERYWTNETLDALQQRLNPAQFFRSHRSSILNLSAEFEFELWEDGRLKVHVGSGEPLIVARDPARELRQRLGF